MVGEESDILSIVDKSCKFAFNHIEQHPLGQPIFCVKVKPTSFSETSSEVAT